MNMRTITAGGRAYEAFYPDPPPTANRPRAVLRARLVDELTGLGLTGRIGLRTEVAGLRPRGAGNGVVGLVGRPQPVFPMLATDPVAVDLRVEAERYLPRDLEVQLGPFNTLSGDPADFPDHFAAAELGDVPMHRAPVVLEGRAMRDAGLGRVPLNGVTIRLTGVWRTTPPADVDPLTVIEAPDILELRPGLYRARRDAVEALRVRVPLIGVADKRLLAPAGPGADQVRLSNRQGLTAGDLLALAPGEPDRAEIIEIAAIDGALDPAQPATVTLVDPLALAHFTGAPAAAAVLPIGPVVDNALLRGGIPGDTTVHLAGIHPSVPDDGIAEIAGLGTPEYHHFRRVRAVTDAEGDYRLPPLSRVAMIRLEASRPDLPAPVEIILAPDYARPVNRLDFVFPP